MNALIPRRYVSGAVPLLRDVRSVDRLFDDLWRGVSAGSTTGVAGNRGGFVPSVSIHENDDEIVLKAELPGLEEKDFEVVLEDDVLTLKGEKKTQHESEEEGWRRVETSAGRFERRFALPFEADADAVKAAYKNGVLTVTVLRPKEARPQVTQIEVTAS